MERERKLLIEYWLDDKPFAMRRRDYGVPRVGDYVRLNRRGKGHVVTCITWHEVDTDTLSELGVRVSVDIEKVK